MKGKPWFQGDVWGIPIVPSVMEGAQRLAKKIEKLQLKLTDEVYVI